MTLRTELDKLGPVAHELELATARWPRFSYDPAVLEPLERQFLLNSVAFVVVFKHVGPDDQNSLKIERAATTL